VKPKSERKLVGDEVSLAKDFSALFYRRPFERGYVVNWELEMEIWNRAFSKHVLGVSLFLIPLLPLPLPPFPLLIHFLLS
jgi:actin-related protein